MNLLARLLALPGGRRGIAKARARRRSEVYRHRWPHARRIKTDYRRRRR